MAENLNAMLTFCQRNLHDGEQPFSQTVQLSYYVRLHVFSKCACVRGKVAGPKPDQPDCLLRLWFDTTAQGPMGFISLGKDLKHVRFALGFL